MGQRCQPATSRFGSNAHQRRGNVSAHLLGLQRRDQDRGVVGNLFQGLITPCVLAFIEEGSGNIRSNFFIPCIHKTQSSE